MTYTSIKDIVAGGVGREGASLKMNKSHHEFFTRPWRGVLDRSA